MVLSVVSDYLLTMQANADPTAFPSPFLIQIGNFTLRKSQPKPFCKFGNKTENFCDCYECFYGKFCDEIQCRNGGKTKFKIICNCPANWSGICCTIPHCFHGSVEGTRCRCSQWHYGTHCQYTSCFNNGFDQVRKNF